MIPDVIINILRFAAELSLLVLIHEFGHFITAKKFGVKVEEFGIGFPPRLFGIRRGETLYSINLLPIGGFVKLYGEDDAGGGKIGGKKHTESKVTDVKRAFYARPAWQRATIVLAGVIMNFALAVAIISHLFTVPGVTVPKGYVEVVKIEKNSPAAQIGVRPGDRIVSYNGAKIISITELHKFLSQNKDKKSTLVIERVGKQVSFEVAPKKYKEDGKDVYRIGMQLQDLETKKYAWWQAPIYGTWEALKFSWMIVSGLGTMVVDFAFRGTAPQGVAGPVGVYQLSNQAASYGIDAWLWFISLLSLNLAVLNVLPIPALDGGRLFFILVELVTRKKVSPRYEAVAHAVGLALLLGLMVLITLQDVIRAIQGKSILPTP